MREVTKKGVYFLADDWILELAITFLNSFRKHNPDIPLCLIPFNSNIDQLKQLGSKYHFSVYSNVEVLNKCDEISSRFHNQVLGAYRKLAMWEGAFDEFIYIDVDTVVLGNLDFVFKYLDDYGFIAGHSNFPNLIQQVWKESIYDSGQLTKEQIGYAANTGYIASRKGSLSLNKALNIMDEAVKLIPHMQLFCMEQTFLNYLIVTSGLKYSSLSVLSWEKNLPDIKVDWWAGSKGGCVKDGQFFVKDDHPPVLFVHWAGLWQPKKLDRIIFALLHALGLKKKCDFPRMTFSMPYKKLWEYYRYLNA